jgi:hypothetical protein
VPGVLANVCFTPSTEFVPSPVRSSHCIPFSAGNVKPNEADLPLTIDASGPTTVHPVIPVESVMKLVKEPVGTVEVSKLPLTTLFARAADTAKTSTKIPKISFQVRMRITLAERGQTVVWRSEVLATCGQRRATGAQ